MDEFERIQAIRGVLQTAAPQVALGIGDDAAILDIGAGQLVVSVDAAVEGVHFRRDFGPLRALGRRACVAALSDLAAMGARPLAMVANVQLPSGFADDALLDLTRGQADAAAEFGAPLVGGNLTSGQDFSITTTVLGTLQGPPLRRDGALPGDLIYCTAPLGAAALGLQTWLRGSDDERAAPFRNAFLYPVAHIAMGLQLVGKASAALDISDGLVQDLGHLCRASNVTAVVELDRLPLLDDQVPLAEHLGLDARGLQLRGGDDYGLLFTAPASAPMPPQAVQIGVVEAPTAAPTVIDSRGNNLAGPRGGFQHFDGCNP